MLIYEFLIFAKVFSSLQMLFDFDFSHLIDEINIAIEINRLNKGNKNLINFTLLRLRMLG